MDKDDKILAALLEDRAGQCENRNVPTRSEFLDMHGRALAERLIRSEGFRGAVFTGGYTAAERQICVFLPDYLSAEDVVNGSASYEPLAVLRVKAGVPGALSHRDYLGSLLALGIRRELVGDILVREDGADIIVLADMADYLAEQYCKAGRVRLTAERRPLRELIVPEAKSECIRDTLASLRLDSVVAAAFRLSRGTAQEAISQGRVSLNSLECLKCDAEVEAGDRISFRGRGRAMLKEIGGRSKKGRTGVVIERFI